MDCLVFPALSILRRRSSGNLTKLVRYRSQSSDYYNQEEEGTASLLPGPEIARPVKVVVGKEKRLFLVDPYVLDEVPFRVLISNTEAVSVGTDEKTKNKGKRKRPEDVVLVDVDSILFEHMLWLMRNDSPSLFRLNLEEIIEFYAQDY